MQGKRRSCRNNRCHPRSQSGDYLSTCGDTCPILPGCRDEEWVLPDPACQPLDAIRPIRDQIEQRVRTLLIQLGVAGGGGG
jgi:hypothetical protein